MPILLVLAVAWTPSARVQREAEDRARSEVADLLRTLCPEQCVLLSVEADRSAAVQHVIELRRTLVIMQSGAINIDRVRPGCRGLTNVFATD